MMRPNHALQRTRPSRSGCNRAPSWAGSLSLGSFNAKAGRFGDNPDAHEHFMKLHALMRDGVGVPEDGAEYTVGPWLTFDPKTEQHTGEFHAEANALLKDANNPGFEVPAPGKV